MLALLARGDADRELAGVALREPSLPLPFARWSSPESTLIQLDLSPIAIYADGRSQPLPAIPGIRLAVQEPRHRIENVRRARGSPGGEGMRIRIISKPRSVDIDGFRLDYFVVGNEYEVGSLLGGVLLVEGWAELVDEQSAPAIQRQAFDARTWANPPNLIREFFPPYYDEPPSFAVDRGHRPRRGAK
jgi:hypothetical protein